MNKNIRGILLALNFREPPKNKTSIKDSTNPLSQCIPHFLNLLLFVIFGSLLIFSPAIAQTDASEIFEDNPDHLTQPVSIDAPVIVFPEAAAEPGISLMRSIDIGTRAVTNPGDVDVDKVAEPVEGMVNTWDITLSIQAKDEIRTSDTVLVIDTSGSMGDEGRMAAAKTAATSFIDQLLIDGNTTNRIALVTFAGSVSTYQNGAFIDSTGRGGLITRINNLVANGGTFTQAGMYQARILLENSSADFKQIVFLSDGEPTYGYYVRSPYKDNNANLVRGNVTWWGSTVEVWMTSPNTPEAEFDYEETVGTGSSMYQRYYDTNGNTNDRYYNMGNHAIAEAGFAKADGYTVYTIALQAGTTGTSVLNSMASPGKSYTATPGNLLEIYNQIAGDIVAAARYASVADPMGTGFTVYDTATQLTPSQGTATFDPETKTISWDVGTLNQPCPAPNTDPTLRCASLTYRIEIDNSVLSVTPPPESGLYSTNGEASFTYTDIEGDEQKIFFPNPSVNPVLYVIEKKLTDYAGNVIASDPFDRTFTFEVTADPAVTGFPKILSLKAGEKIVLTNLRFQSNYAITETGVGGYADAALSDYVTTIQGETPYYIKNDETPDMNVAFTNQEKPLGVLNIVKRYYDLNGTEIEEAAFNFNVTCPDFTDDICPAEAGITNPITVNSGITNAIAIQNLPYLRYQVSEEVPTGMSASANPAPGIVTLTVADREQTVTYSNNENTSIGSGRFYKAWIGGPTDPHPDICFRAMQRDYDSTDDFTPTGYVYKIDYDQTPVVNDGKSYYTFYWPNVPLSYMGPDNTIIDYEYMVEEGTCDCDQEGVCSNFLPFENNAPENYTSTWKNEQNDGNLWNTPEYDVTMVNTYTIPTNGVYSAEKIWVNGPEPKPSLWFQLYRQTAAMTAAEAVPGLAPVQLDGNTDATCTELPCGYEDAAWQASWRGLEETDINGNAYTYSFQEGFLENGTFAPGAVPGYAQLYDDAAETPNVPIPTRA